MIAILDNGKSYSDHRIAFVTCAEDEDVTLLRNFCELHALCDGSAFSKWTIIGIVEKVEWFAGKPDQAASFIQEESWSLSELRDDLGEADVTRGEALAKSINKRVPGAALFLSEVKL